jgi:hypothetical protein
MSGLWSIALSFLCLLLAGVPVSRADAPGSLAAPQNATVEVDVACDGTGTRLQDALDELHPFASAYEVRVSGYCPEPLYIEKFLYLRLMSADAGARASVGKIYVASSAHNVYVDRLRVVDTGEKHVQSPSFSIRAGNNRFEMNDSEVVCEATAASYAGCRGVLKETGVGAFYNVDLTGEGWIYRTIESLRSSVQLVAYDRGSYAFEPCLEMDRVRAEDRGYMLVYQGVGCPPISVDVSDHSFMRFFLADGSSIANTYAGDFGKLIVYDRSPPSGANGKSRTYRQMVGSTSCGLFSIAVASGEAKKNYCGT